MSKPGSINSIYHYAPDPRTCFRSAHILACLHGYPLGFLDFELDNKAPDLTTTIGIAWRSLQEAIVQHASIDGLPLSMIEGAPTKHLTTEVDYLNNYDQSISRHLDKEDFGQKECRKWRDVGGGTPPISVVLCTRNRASQLLNSLQALLNISYEKFEVIVVDNDPSDESTRNAVEAMVGNDDRFTYVVEPARGLSNARNRGLRVANNQIVAFIDDDTIADPMWLRGIAKGFRMDPNAGCVTGLVSPAQLDNEYQHYFYERITWPTAIETRVFDLVANRDTSPLYPFNGGMFGIGANFAVDRSYATSLGYFDPILGAGGPVGGGEDIDMFSRIILGGRSLVYEPAAIVWDILRADEREIKDQLYTYGRGLGGYLAKHLSNPQYRSYMLRRTPFGILHMLNRFGKGRRYGKQSSMLRTNALIRTEISGIFAGLLIYWQVQHKTVRYLQ